MIGTLLLHLFALLHLECKIASIFVPPNRTSQREYCRFKYMMFNSTIARFKQQMEAYPLGDHQIHAMQKFEDRPMSPVEISHLVNIKIFTNL